jgi:cysteine desulfurase/selenocysteine lyase
MINKKGNNLSVEEVRKHIPFINNCIYVDNGSTTPVPIPVMEAMNTYFLEYGTNVGRGGYKLAIEATRNFDLARKKTAELLLNCKMDELIFTRNLTHASNIVAYALEHPPLETYNGIFDYGEPLIKWEKGDKIITTVMEHHANFMPWMRLAKNKGIDLRIVEPTKDGILRPETFYEAVDEKTKFVAFQHVSNSMGTIHPVKEIIKAVKEKNPSTLVYNDGSQGPGHLPVDVNDFGCDFYGFSGHKGPLGPQGTGGLFAKKDILMNMAVMELGGGIVSDVTVDGWELQTDVASKRFDAGTPNIVGCIGLGRAAEYVTNEIGLEEIKKREHELTIQLLEGIRDLKNIHLYVPEDSKYIGGTVTFNLDGWKCSDLSLALAKKWTILTRAGHHCTIPLMRFLNILDTYGGHIRVTFHYYNTEQEVDIIIKAITSLAQSKP